MVRDFDLAASEYDREFTFSSIGKAQRLRVHHYLDRWLEPTDPLELLEVNCGTGEDARYLAQKGYRVLATDASNSMLEQARSKQLGSAIRYQQLDLKELKDLNAKAPFGAVFSNFGGLNCLPPQELNTFFKTAAELLPEQGSMFVVLMSRSCLLEQLYFLLKGDRTKAYRRRSEGPLEVPVHGAAVQTWYYDPKDVLALLPEGLTIRKARPIGLTIPPSYLQNAMDRFPILLKLAKAIEPVLAWSTLAKRGDHYILKIDKS